MLCHLRTPGSSYTQKAASNEAADYTDIADISDIMDLRFLPSKKAGFQHLMTATELELAIVEAQSP